jgi:5S rRNA maturation endonuclease (ribonuclease M5)
LVWAENTETGRQGWKSQGFEGKPIYGLEKLTEDKNTVLIVEGEKTADAASHILPEYTVISWLGGVNSVSQVDWKVLAGRRVVIWPDADQPGVRAAEVISEKLEGVAQDVAIINPYMLKFDSHVHENILTAKWDLADTLPQAMTQDSVREAIENAQNARLELTSNNIIAAIDKAGINDQQIYAQVSKQAKELAAVSKLYPDSESLVKQVLGDVKAVTGLIQDIGFTTSKEALELNDIVKGGALGNKFHESLLSHIYIKEQVEGKELPLSDKLSRAIKGYDKLEKGLTFLQDKKYNDEIKTACDFLVGVQGVSRKAADVFVQAVKDIVLLDKVTTQALHHNFEYFKEVTTQIRDIFIENKDILMQTSDVLNESTIKSIYNHVYENVVCNDKLAGSMIKANDAFALNHIQRKDQRFNNFLKAYKVELIDIQRIQPDFNIAKLQEELRLASESDRESIIESTWLRIFKAYASAETNKLVKAREEAKTINEMIKVMNQEKKFSQEFFDNYSGLAMHTSLKELNDKVRTNYLAYTSKPETMDIIKRDIENLKQFNNISPETICNILKGDSDHSKVTNDISKICHERVNSMIESDLKVFKTGMKLKKGNIELNSISEYKNYIENNAYIKPYLKESLGYKQLNEYHNIHKLEEHRNQQLEILRQQSKGMDRDK